MAEWNPGAEKEPRSLDGAASIVRLPPPCPDTPSCKEQGSPASTSAESPAVCWAFEDLARTHLELGTSSSLCRGSGMRRTWSEASENV